MKKYLISAVFILSTLGFTAQAALVTTIKDFTQGDVFTASGLASSVNVDLIIKPGSPATVDAVVAGSNTTGFFDHDYIFSPITSMVVSLSSGSTNAAAGGIAGLMMTVANLTVPSSTTVAIPVGGSDSIPLNMMAGNTYSIKMFNTGLIANVTGGYLLAVSNVPVPAAVWLFGTALLGLFGVQRRKAKALIAA